MQQLMSSSDNLSSTKGNFKFLTKDLFKYVNIKEMTKYNFQFCTWFYILYYQTLNIIPEI